MNQPTKGTTIITTPIYVKCFFFDKENDFVISIYRIESTLIVQYPFQLFKLSTSKPHVWQNLSTYVSVYDAIRVLLKELLTDRLDDGVHSGQASVSPQQILDRLNHGERSVSVFNSIDNELFRAGDDVFFEELVQQK